MKSFLIISNSALCAETKFSGGEADEKELEGMELLVNLGVEVRQLLSRHVVLGPTKPAMRA